MSEVLLVGCGVPGRSMGWFHAQNILDGKVNGVKKIVGVVDAFLAKNPNDAFEEFVHKNNLNVYESIEEFFLSNSPQQTSLFALIAVRTCDTPKFFAELIDHGVKHIYLEKPGATTVGELRNMQSQANENGCQVIVGYARNCHSFVDKTLVDLEEANEKNGVSTRSSTPAAGTETMDGEKAKSDGKSVSLFHMNSYKADQMGECFSRNSEGMLRNMACHDIALAVKYFGLSIEHCIKNAELIFKDDATLLSTIGEHEDFVRLKFKVTFSSSFSLYFNINRQGGDWAGMGCNVEIAGNDDLNNKNNDDTVVKKDAGTIHKMPDDLEKYEEDCAREPNTMRYFFMQKDAYCVYMAKFVESMNLFQDGLSQANGVSGVSSNIVKGTASAIGNACLCDLNEACAVLEIADYLTTKFKKEYHENAHKHTKS